MKVDDFLELIEPIYFGNLAGDCYNEEAANKVAALKHLVTHFRAHLAGNTSLEANKHAERQAELLLDKYSTSEANGDPMEPIIALQMLAKENKWLAERVGQKYTCNNCYLCAFNTLDETIQQWRWRGVYKEADY